ncbi:hypothetical protein [Sphingobium sp.]|uniref:hypothetical protein n=1 Tax=Sphingobium sp. TaxID=1912891 RepID=UPI002C7791AF|nr:hypothetical protein [Sphingobium sp.]HUD90052.1 hypothetical protein [Sphingobium sp.]
MSNGVNMLMVVMKPPRWDGGLPMLMLCDQNGDALPGQTQCQVTTRADGTSQVVATFEVSGTDVQMSRG